MKEISVYRLNIGSCNGCDIEVVSVLASRFGVENLGVRVVDEPEKANALVLTGILNRKMVDVLREVYQKIQEPKIVVAVGSCAVSSGIFGGSYAAGGVSDEVIPVTAYVPGCAPSPHEIISAIAEAVALPKGEFSAPGGFRGLPKVNEEKCTGCGACVISCPALAIEMKDDGGRRKITYFYERCISCGRCEEVCPEEAVKLEQKRHPASRKKEEMKDEADEPLAVCPVCGGASLPEKQVKVILERATFEAPLLMEFMGELEKTVRICQQCRRNGVRISEAKAALYRIGLKAMNNRQI
ncbi:MAG: 4Fe-4S binding protein [Candidatus Hadarchaeales archaeon]